VEGMFGDRLHADLQPGREPCRCFQGERCACCLQWSPMNS
jgi:hypothetical protein